MATRSRGLRRGARVAVLAAAIVASGSTATAKPARVVSINLCTDQNLLVLADRERIRSVSHVAAQPAYSTVAADVAGIPLNHGGSEEILPLDPDLIVAGRLTARSTVLMLQRLGYTVVALDISRSLADIRDRVAEMGRALGEDDRAAAVIAAFDSRLRALQADIGAERPTALYLQPNGYTSGRNSLVGDIIEQAGFENLGASLGIDGFGHLPLEKVLAAAPDVLITDEDRPSTPALAYEALEHPAIGALFAGSHRVSLPIRYVICGMPETLKAVEILAEARRRLQGKAGR